MCSRCPLPERCWDNRHEGKNQSSLRNIWTIKKLTLALRRGSVALELQLSDSGMLCCNATWQTCWPMKSTFSVRLGLATRQSLSNTHIISVIHHRLVCYLLSFVLITCCSVCIMWPCISKSLSINSLIFCQFYSILFQIKVLFGPNQIYFIIIVASMTSIWFAFV